MATGIGTVRQKRAWWPGWVSRCRRALLDLLFPPRCASCDADLAGSSGPMLLCDRCQEGMAPWEWFGCPSCGAAMAPGPSTALACRACWGTPFHFDTVVPLGGYSGSLREIVLRMKRVWGEPLSVAMGEYLVLRRGDRLAALEPEVVVPVPMYWGRRWVRKTNSPDVVADRLARFLGIPLLERALRRSRNTRPQKDLRQLDRFQNVRGAFRLRAGYDLRDARVLLVDDVLTTGATCNEAAKVLKQDGGAKAVAVAVLARAEGDEPQGQPK